MANSTGDPWQGLFTVTRVLGVLSYVVYYHGGQRGKKHLYVTDRHQWVTCLETSLAPTTAACFLKDPGELCEGDLPWQDRAVPICQPVLDDALSPLQKEDLESLLRKHPGIFSKQPGYTTLVEHTIPCTPGKVACALWRPIPFKTQEAVEREVKEMLLLGVIEPSHSAWRSPVVLVPKPDDTVRFCVDNQEVNKLVDFNAYPMPQANILIGQLGQAQFLSALNLTKGYWQVHIRPQDCGKTAFATPTDLFQFKRIPFGLPGATTTF